MKKFRSAKRSRKISSNRRPVDAITREVTVFKAAKLAELGHMIDQELKKIQVSAMLHEFFLRALSSPDSVLPRRAVKV